MCRSRSSHQARARWSLLPRRRTGFSLSTKLPALRQAEACPTCGHDTPQPAQPKPFTLMLVEKSPKSQEAFRRFFGALGVRMLITTNPDRALARLAEPSAPAKGIVFSGLELAAEAVHAFNAMAAHPDLQQTPAIMIATPKQQSLIETAQCDGRRKILFVPLTVPEVTVLLAELFGYQPPPPADKPA